MAEARARAEATWSVATEDERGPLGAILAHAFGFPSANAAEWFLRAGHENVYAWREGPTVVGGMIFAPMGQWFGGRSVPTIGLAGVGMTPERRGEGAGGAMMRAAIRAMRARGAALSTLYPSTVPFYRKLGYERAGARFLVTLSPGVLAGTKRDADLEVVRGTPDRTPELDLLQSRWASRHAGALDRGPYVWGRALRPPRDEAPAVFAIRRAGALVGHLVVVHKPLDGHDTEVVVTDAAAEDGSAARAILDVLAGYRSICARIRWQMHVPSLFSMSLADRTHETRLVDHWLLRVLDVRAALEARGYPRDVKARVEIEVDDPLVPEHHGRHRVEIEGGRARVSEGAAGARAVTMGPRGLAALFAGYMSASELDRLELLRGDAGDLDAVDAVFRGPMPTLAEMF
jgi:predicted acetyltransferase